MSPSVGGFDGSVLPGAIIEGPALPIAPESHASPRAPERPRGGSHYPWAGCLLSLSPVPPPGGLYIAPQNHSTSEILLFCIQNLRRCRRRLEKSSGTRRRRSDKHTYELQSTMRKSYADKQQNNKK